MTAGGPQFRATPQNPDLLRWVGIQVLLLVIAWLIGLVVRRLLASRMTMSTASAACGVACWSQAGSSPLPTCGAQQ